MDECTNEKLSGLIIKITEGDSDAVDEIFSIMGKVSMAIAYRILRNKQDAEEVVHDTFAQIVVDAQKYRYQKNAYAWINTIIKHNALNKLKKVRRLREVELDSARTCTLDNVDESSLIVEEIFEMLTPKEQDYLQYRYWYGLSYDEIGKIFGKSKSAVRERIAKIEEKIKRLYKN